MLYYCGNEQLFWQHCVGHCHLVRCAVVKAAGAVIGVGGDICRI